MLWWEYSKAEAYREEACLEYDWIQVYFTDSEDLDASKGLVPFAEIVLVCNLTDHRSFVA